MSSVQPEPSLPERFDVETLLAVGDRCSVYRAFDRDAQCTVVLKQFRHRDGALYLRESAAGLSLRHPNLLTCREALYPNADASCLVFDYMGSGTLRDRISRDGALSAAELRHCLEDLLTGLMHLHASGWLHRDLKPDNIYLDDYLDNRLDNRRDSGAARTRFLIGDFGSACTIAEAEAGAGGAGTPAYSAPETRFRHTSARSDLYSLGMLALEAATGTLPFAPNLAAARAARRHAGLDLGAVADADCRDFLAMLLEADPARRCPDAATALRILEGLHGSERMAALPLRLASRSRRGSRIITHFREQDGAMPRGIKLLRRGSRHALLLEQRGYGDLLHLPLPCTRRSLPMQHDVMQLDDEQIAFVAGQRLQLLDVHRGQRRVVGDLPRGVLGCRHDGQQALCVGATGLELLNLAQNRSFTAPFPAGHSQSLAPALCLFDGGGFAASGGALNRQVTFYDAEARPGQSLHLPDNVLALLPAERGFLHALTLSTRERNRYTLWQLHRFLEPRRFQTDHAIVAWSTCGSDLDLLFADGSIGRVREGDVDPLGGLPMNPARVAAFGVSADGLSIATASQEDDHRLITLIQLH